MNTSRKLLLAGAAAIAAAATASSALAQNSAVGTADAKVTIIRPITITKVTDLSFGRVVSNATGGTVAIGTGADTASPTGVTMLSGGTISRASFTVGGEGGQGYTIQLPTSVNLGATNLDVDTFASSPSSPGTLSGTIGSAGSETLYVGATLHVPGNVAAGNYTGSFNVTVTYQ